MGLSIFELISLVARRTADADWRNGLPSDGRVMPAVRGHVTDTTPDVTSTAPDIGDSTPEQRHHSSGSRKGSQWHKAFGSARAQLESLTQPIAYNYSDQATREQVFTEPAGVTIPFTEQDDENEEEGGTERGSTLVIEVELYEGKNRQIRRLCKRAGLVVVSLQRVELGPLMLGPLKCGDARSLSRGEVVACYEACSGAELGAGTYSIPEPLPVPFSKMPSVLTRSVCVEILDGVKRDSNGHYTHSTKHRRCQREQGSIN